MLLVLLIVLGYLNRRFVAAQIRGPAAPRGPMSDVRIAVAAVWHVPVILDLFGLYGVWALNMHEGFPTMLRGTLLSLLAGVLGLVAMHLIDNLFRGGLRLSADLQPQLPGTKTRFRKYLPALRATSSS